MLPGEELRLPQVVFSWVFPSEPGSRRTGGAARPYRGTRYLTVPRKQLQKSTGQATVRPPTTLYTIMWLSIVIVAIATEWTTTTITTAVTAVIDTVSDPSVHRSLPGLGHQLTASRNGCWKRQRSACPGRPC